MLTSAVCSDRLPPRLLTPARPRCTDNCLEKRRPGAAQAGNPAWRLACRDVQHRAADGEEQGLAGVTPVMLRQLLKGELQRGHDLRASGGAAGTCGGSCRCTGVTRLCWITQPAHPGHGQGCCCQGFGANGSATKWLVRSTAKTQFAQWCGQGAQGMGQQSPA